MNQYITVKGIYKKGNVRLLEIPDQNLDLGSEVMVLIPIGNNRTQKIMTGIPINDFVKKMNLFAIGGDAVKDTEDLYND